jgi:hypothetical protein
LSRSRTIYSNLASLEVRPNYSHLLNADLGNQG